MERAWMVDAACTLKGKRRLLACGGREAGWVTAMPSAREYQLTNDQWRDAVSSRLHLPLSFLVAGPTHCDCHNAFDRRSGDIAQGVVGTTHRPGFRTSIPGAAARLLPLPCIRGAAWRPEDAAGGGQAAPRSTRRRTLRYGHARLD